MLTYSSIVCAMALCLTISSSHTDIVLKCLIRHLAANAQGIEINRNVARLSYTVY